MERIFVFLVSELSYRKRDLNVPFSVQRVVIGELARMITNALFLSHSLRKQLTVQIFIQKPKPHVLVIRGEEIRYLGPELRSSASILLKVEEMMKKKAKEPLQNILHWFQPHRGLFARFQEEPLTNLFTDTTSCQIFAFHSNLLDTSLSNLKSFSFINDFEHLIEDSSQKIESFIFLFPVGELKNNLSWIYNYQKGKLLTFRVNHVFDSARIISVINVLLDQLEEKKGN